MGTAALALDGVKIDVPTHRANPPKLAIPATSVIERKPIPGSKLEAVGAIIAAPPFAARHLYVYVASDAKQCTGARLAYRLGGGPEHEAQVDQFPCQWAVRLPDLTSPVRRSVTLK